MTIVLTRFYNNKLLRNKDGKLVLNTWAHMNPDDLVSEDDIPYEMKIGDRLDSLAKINLGSEKNWWMITAVNGMRHFWDWKVGNVIRIPKTVNRFLSYVRSTIDTN